MIAKLQLDLAEDDHPASLVPKRMASRTRQWLRALPVSTPPEIACANNLLNRSPHYATVIAEL